MQLQAHLDQGRARDAVWTAFEPDQLGDAIGQEMVTLRSEAGARFEYLKRPDLGRRVHPDDLPSLTRGDYDLALVIADGLSAAAVHAHAAAVSQAIIERLPDWSLAPIVAVHQGRVAIGDPIGAALGAKIVCVLIGERPGMSAHDSLGAYITWNPADGRKDSERNCISNIRPPDGLSYADAADRIVRILKKARVRKCTGIALGQGLGVRGQDAIEPPR